MVLIKVGMALVLLAFTISYLCGYDQLQGHKRRRRPKVIRASAFVMLSGMMIAFFSLLKEAYRYFNA